MTSIESVLELCPEPCIVLDGEAKIVHANSKARCYLETDDCAGRKLVEFLHDNEPDVIEDIVAKASGSTMPRPAKLKLGPDISDHAVVIAQRLLPAEPLRIGVRFPDLRQGRFKALTKKVDALNAEVRERHRLQHRLEISLQQNILLMRELQHRVKNNIHVIISLLEQQARRSEDQVFHDLVDTATRRLLAMSRIHELMYRRGEMSQLDGHDLILSLLESLKSATDSTVSFVEKIEAGWSLTNDQAGPVALIINELITNAIQHATSDEGLQIIVKAGLEDSKIVLSVKDNGPGFQLDERSSESLGLTMVKGLCAQLAASFNVESVNGAQCSVRFKHIAELECPDGESEYIA